MAETSRDVVLTLKARGDGSVARETKKIGDELKKLEKPLDMKKAIPPSALEEYAKSLAKTRGDLMKVNESFGRASGGAESLARGLLMIGSSNKSIEQLAQNLAKFQGFMDVGRGIKELGLGAFGLYEGHIARKAAAGVVGSVASSATGTAIGQAVGVAGGAAVGAGGTAVAAKTGVLAWLSAWGSTILTTTAPALAFAAKVTANIPVVTAISYVASKLLDEKIKADQAEEEANKKYQESLDRRAQRQAITDRITAKLDRERPFREQQEALARQSRGMAYRATEDPRVVAGLEVGDARYAQRNIAEQLHAYRNPKREEDQKKKILAVELDLVNQLIGATQRRIAAEQNVLMVKTQQRDREVESIKLLGQAATQERQKQQAKLEEARNERKSVAERYGDLTMMDKWQLDNARNRLARGEETPQDRERLRGFGFDEMLRKKAFDRAEKDPGFAALAKQAGIDDRIAKGFAGVQQATRMEVKLAQEIDIVLKLNKEELGKMIADKITPVLEDLIRMIGEAQGLGEALAGQNRNLANNK